MKKSSVFYIRTSLVVLGFTLIAFGFFTEFQSTCGFVDGYEDIMPISISGSESPLWYFFSFGSVLIFSIGYFFNHLANKILVYCFASILTLFITFVTWISQAGWGKPCGHSSEYGYHLTLLGSLLVLTVTIISMNRKKKLLINDSDHLLD
nr:hypothetical protein [uncultured Fluviicola sp.]